MLESALEQLFFKQVRAAGGVAIKLMPTHAGVPDRLVLWPGGRTALVELKQKTGTVSPVQRVWHERAANLGHPVVVLYGADEVRAWIQENA
jgi:hypothetical protein